MDTNVIKKHMSNLLRSEFCIDKSTGEVNCTQLAEMTADDLDLYEDDEDFTIPEEVFDLAVTVSDLFEKGL